MMKKSKFTKKKVIVLLIFFVAVPLVIQLHWTPFYQIAKLLTPGDKSDWLGFWGSYLGFIPAGLVTYVVLEFQFERQSKIDARNAEDQLKKQKQEFLFEQDYASLTEMRKIVDESYRFMLRSKRLIETGESHDDDFIFDFYKYFGDRGGRFDVNLASIKNWAEEFSLMYGSNKFEGRYFANLDEPMKELIEKQRLLQNKIAYQKDREKGTTDEIQKFELDDMLSPMTEIILFLKKLKNDIFLEQKSIRGNLSA